MRRRLALFTLTGIAAVGAAVPAVAQSVTGPSSSSLPVTVHASTHGGVFVDTALGSQPLVGASVANSKACVGFSQQVPQCVDYSPVTDALPANWSVGPVQVYNSTADGGVTVGTAIGSQPLVGASVGNGQVCVGISLEVPVCRALPFATIGHPVSDSPNTPISVPVRVWYSTNGGVTVGTAFNAQPLVGASVSDSGRVCVGFSYEIPFCAGLVSPNAKAE